MTDKEGKPLNKLTIRKRMFILNYLKTYNATQAAKEAGYSAKTARSQGQRLLTNVDIQKAIAAAERRIESKISISKERILKELALIGFSDIREYVTVDANGCIKAVSIENLPLGASCAIKKVKEKRVIKSIQRPKDKSLEDIILEITFEFELHNKITALLNMGKELGMFRERHNVGLDIKTVESILSALPPDYAEAVRVKLSEIKVK